MVELIYTVITQYKCSFHLTSVMHCHFFKGGNLTFYFCFNSYLFLTSSYVYQTLISLLL